MKLSQIQENFEALAAEDPFWTVLSEHSKRGRKWIEDEFYLTGVNLIDDLERRLKMHDITMNGRTALDFGCGVGRLSFPLAKRFEQSIGVDISKSMIETANANLHRGSNCQFILNTKDNLECLNDFQLDFAYSDIVFQHMAPRYAKGYIREISRLLRPGGIFAFQLPSHLNKAIEDNRRPFRLLQKKLYYGIKSISQKLGLEAPYFEMNAIDQNALLQFAAKKTALKLVCHWDYPAAGENWQSFMYVFKKAI